MPCTASMSSVCSSYQPRGSCRGFCGRLNPPGGITWVKLALVSFGRPCRAEYSLTSRTIVGEAYASMIATVWPVPSFPAATADATPYALRNWSGVCPQASHGFGCPKATGTRAPAGVRVVAVFFWFQYAEHGGAGTNAGDGLADGERLADRVEACGAIIAVDSSSPTTAVI